MKPSDHLFFVITHTVDSVACIDSSIKQGSLFKAGALWRRMAYLISPFPLRYKGNPRPSNASTPPLSQLTPQPQTAILEPDVNPIRKLAPGKPNHRDSTMGSCRPTCFIVSTRLLFPGAGECDAICRLEDSAIVSHTKVCRVGGHCTIVRHISARRAELHIAHAYQFHCYHIAHTFMRHYLYYLYCDVVVVVVVASSPPSSS